MEDLQNLKYKELQKLAKAAGIKANSPKADLIEALQSLNRAKEVAVEEENETPKNVNKSLRDNVDVEVQNKLNETFEKENSTLNVTFEKDDENNETKDSQQTVDQSEDGSSSRFVEFMEEDKNEISFRRSTRSSTPISAIKSRKSNVSNTPRNDYLTKKCKTPLRKVLKTPGTIQKKSEKKGESNIPRFLKGRVGKVPNFAKIHARSAKKLESLDDFLEKKKKLTDTVRKQLDKAKALAEEHNSIVSQVKSRLDTDNKKFVPSVTSTAKMNLNFGSSRKSGNNPFQFSAKPVAAAPKVVAKERKDVKEVTKKAGKTAKKAPGRRDSDPKPLMNITNNKSLNLTNNKSLNKTPGKAGKFDLAASLAKGLSYQPHKGKVMPLEKKKKETVPLIAACTQEEAKQRQMDVIKGVRLNKRAELLMMRRKVSN